MTRRAIAVAIGLTMGLVCGPLARAHHGEAPVFVAPPASPNLLIRTKSVLSAEAAIPAISRVLRTGTEAQQVWILHNLTMLPEALALKLAPAVLEVADTTTATLTRAAAVAAASYVARDEPRLIAILNRALADPERELRRMAANVAGGMGAKAEPLLPDLERLAREEPDSLVPQHALNALEKVRSELEKKP